MMMVMLLLVVIMMLMLVVVMRVINTDVGDGDDDVQGWVMHTEDGSISSSAS